MIEYLTHYYRKGTQPFSSLSALPDQEALRIMQELYIEGSVIWERFEDPCGYLHARRETEAWLRREFIAKGGDPLDPYPVYVALGRPQWVARMADPGTLAATAEIRVPLSIFSERDISFTYPDSMVTLFLENEKNPAYYQPDFHGKVFTLTEIRDIVAAKGMPDEGWDTDVPYMLAHYIEGQVWNRELLLRNAEQFTSANTADLREGL